MRLTRLALSAAALAGVLLAAGADDKKADGPTLDASGSIGDVELMKHAPVNGVVVSQKGLDALAKAWGLTELPKVDFAKELVVVSVTRGGRLSLKPAVKDGDLKAVAISTRDFSPGFRYALVSVKKDGVKTVNGKELPKE